MVGRVGWKNIEVLWCVVVIGRGGKEPAGFVVGSNDGVLAPVPFFLRKRMW